MLSFEQAAALLLYDPETGEFAWKERKPGHHRDGVVGTINGHGHRIVMIDRRQYYLHRLAWLLTHGDWPTKDLDHLDGDPANNKLANLREATCSQNMGNARRSKANTSGFKGVTWHKRLKKWQAQIMVDRRNYSLGYFTTVEAAHVAYCAAAQERFGEFANSGVVTCP